MSAVMADVGHFVLTFAVHGTLWFVVAWLAHGLFRRADVLRETLWRAALVGGLVTATVALATGRDTTEPSGLVTRTMDFAASGVAEVENDSGIVLEASPGAAFPGAAGSLPAELPLAADGLEALTGPGVVDSPSLAWSSPSVALPTSVATWAGWLATLAAIVGLARLGARRVALRRLLADRREILDAGELAVLRELADRAGHPRIPRLTASTRLDVPIAFGTLHPEICVPAKALTSLAPAAREAMLAHELAHLAGRDPLWLELAHTLEALFPWQPLYGVARRRLDALAEYRCDAVGGSWADPLAVADCLVEVAAWLGAGRGRAVTLGVAGMAAERAGLASRVDRLLDDPVRGVPGRGARAVAGLAAAAGIALGAGAMPAVPVSAAGDGGGLAAVASPRPVRGSEVVADVPVDGADAAVAAGEDLRDELRALASELEVEQLRLELEVEALRADVLAIDDSGEFAAVLAALDTRIADLDRRRRDIAAAIDSLAVEPAGAAVPRSPEAPERRR